MGALIGVGSALIFALGFFARDITSSAFPVVLASPVGQECSYPLLSEVQNLLNQHYLHPQPDPTQRQYAAIRGLMGSLEDRYTFFIDPPVAQSESDVLAGTYGGIGVQVVRDESGEFIVFPFDDSPAQAAGIANGDILRSVNGQVLDLSVAQDTVDQMLRGEVRDNSGVELGIVKSDGQEQTVFVEFAVINVPSVIWRMVEEDLKVGYLQIIRFTSRTPEELDQALSELIAQDVAALVLDLRNNSGGLLQESVAVAGQFLPADQVVVFEQNNENERILKADGERLTTELPLVVLVNQGTASASELVAGAIQDHERGILIGQRTFGKGTVQQIFRLSDDSSVHITSAEWLTPQRRRLENIGLEPNVTMIPDENGRDIELGEALRYLRQNLELES
jgi:carboxyl-terminal processing protease